MNKIYYKKTKKININFFRKIFGVVVALAGLSVALYIFIPLILWQLFVSPALAQAELAVPIPQTTLVTPGSIASLFSSQLSVFDGTNSYDAKNWFPTYNGGNQAARVSYYSISIPKLNIINAVVSTVDSDLAKHLVNLSGTSIPPDKGNTVIFGHSTLPSLYDPKNYKTIFANILNLQVGDEILVNVDNITYTYKIFSIRVIDPDNTSVLAQTTDDSYLSLITCTPPGTIWKRLVLKARLQTL
ncbi:MAG TPA: sortase [Patescibacteria group bacterium]